MRIYLSLFALLVLLSSCVDYRSYYSIHQEKMTDLNFAPREGNLDVFFKGESQPTKDYLRIGLVKKNRTSFTSNISALMESMESDALEMGADALIVMGTGDQKQIYTNIIVEDTYSVPKESMWGIAIKYVDGIAYDGNVLKQMNVVSLAGDNESKGGEIVLDRQGELTSTLENRATVYAYYHSMEYLMESKKGWSFAKSTTEDYSYSYILLRERKNRNGTTTRMKAKMKRNDMPGELVIYGLSNHLTSIKMEIVTDENKRIIERSWGEDNRKKVKAIRNYDTKGRLLSERYEIKERGAVSFSPYLLVNYEYLSEEEFSAELSKEQIVKIEP